MSVRVMTAVFDHSESTGNDRVVLLVIADRSGDDGEGCWRGRESIARMARVDKATVSRALKRLEELGELVVDRRPGTTSLYRIILPGVGADCNYQGVTDCADGRRAGAPGVGAPVQRDTSLTVHDPQGPLWDFNEKGEAVWKGNGPAPSRAPRTWS